MRASSGSAKSRGGGWCIATVGRGERLRCNSFGLYRCVYPVYPGCVLIREMARASSPLPMRAVWWCRQHHGGAGCGESDSVALRGHDLHAANRTLPALSAIKVRIDGTTCPRPVPHPPLTSLSLHPSLRAPAAFALLHHPCRDGVLLFQTATAPEPVLRHVSLRAAPTRRPSRERSDIATLLVRDCAASAPPRPAPPRPAAPPPVPSHERTNTDRIDSHILTRTTGRRKHAHPHPTCASARARALGSGSADALRRTRPR
jgi:hypothetical protein